MLVPKAAVEVTAARSAGAIFCMPPGGYATVILREIAELFRPRIEPCDILTGISALQKQLKWQAETE